MFVDRFLFNVKIRKGSNWKIIIQKNYYSLFAFNFLKKWFKEYKLIGWLSHIFPSPNLEIIAKGLEIPNYMFIFIDKS